MAFPHELENPSASAEGFRTKVDFGFARLPEALPLPLISRKLGKSRWQLQGRSIPIAFQRVEVRCRLWTLLGPPAMSAFAPLSGA